MSEAQNGIPQVSDMWNIRLMEWLTCQRDHRATLERHDCSAWSFITCPSCAVRTLGGGLDGCESVSESGWPAVTETQICIE